MYGIKVLIEVDGKGVKSDWVTAVLKTGSFLGFMTIVSPFLSSPTANAVVVFCENSTCYGIVCPYGRQQPSVISLFKSAA